MISKVQVQELRKAYGNDLTALAAIADYHRMQRLNEDDQKMIATLQTQVDNLRKLVTQ